VFKECRRRSLRLVGLRLERGDVGAESGEHVRGGHALGPLDLHLEALHPNLEPVHGLDRAHRRLRIVVAHKP
jgi:hypothetical protein